MRQTLSIALIVIDGRPRCWGQGGRPQARLAQELFHRRQDSGAKRHEELSERAAATVMSAYAVAIRGKADIACCTAYVC